MDNKKQELLATAYKLIRTKGFDSFSYHDLSKEIGITKASIHYYYPSKEELGLAICDLIIRNLGRLKTTVSSLASPREKLDLYIQAMFGEVKEGLMCPILSLQAEYDVLPDSMKKKIREITEIELDIVSGILQEGLDQGIFKFDGDAVSQAALLVTSFKSATLYARVLEKDLIKRIIDQFYRQLKIEK
ncbi:MAG: TetR/AcrR family transcriptional regulator [Desulfotomaculaceae bacterium]|nr:TetR/AcrR family transcriptional regulator [Desulfotomaculaceae bacterium]